jgi:hypothetical protein
MRWRVWEEKQKVGAWLRLGRGPVRSGKKNDACQVGWTGPYA